jgi:hypothetical protein
LVIAVEGNYFLRDLQEITLLVTAITGRGFVVVYITRYRACADAAGCTVAVLFVVFAAASLIEKMILLAAVFDIRSFAGGEGRTTHGTGSP